MSRPRRLAVMLVAVAAAIMPVVGAAPAPAHARASLTDIYGDVMCVACHESLAVAQSPQAQSEKNYIRQLVDQGETKRQVEAALVASYGPQVLALPPAHGFDLLIYIVPPAVVVIGILTLVLAIPRRRRRSREAAARPALAGPALTAADAHRLDEELGRYA